MNVVGGLRIGSQLTRLLLISPRDSARLYGITGCFHLRTSVQYNDRSLVLYRITTDDRSADLHAMTDAACNVFQLTAIL